jgi:hypothetical protein
VGHGTTDVASPRSLTHPAKLYSAECVEGAFSEVELRVDGFLRSWV